MPYNDIETVTGIPLNTVKSHIFRAKKLLKADLEKQGICSRQETAVYHVFFKLNFAYDLR